VVADPWSRRLKKQGDAPINECIEYARGQIIFFCLCQLPYNVCTLVTRRGMHIYASGAKTGGNSAVLQVNWRFYMGKIRGGIWRFLDAHTPPDHWGADGMGANCSTSRRSDKVKGSGVSRKQNGADPTRVRCDRS
jgi:hypothetical protein